MGAAFGVGAAGWVVAEPVQDDDEQGVVGAAVSATVELVSVHASAAGRDGGGTAQLVRI